MIITVDKILDEVQPEALLALAILIVVWLYYLPNVVKFRHSIWKQVIAVFDMRVPEEINRRIVDHTADINLTYSTIARDYLLAEGLPADLVIKTGSPMFEVLNHYKAKIEASDVLERLSWYKQQYFIVKVSQAKY